MLRVRSNSTQRSWPVQEVREERDGYRVTFGGSCLKFTLDGRGPPNTKYVMEMTS